MLAHVLVLVLLLLLLLHQALELQALLLEPLYFLRRFHPQLQLHFLLQVLRTPQSHLRLLRLLVTHHQQLQRHRHRHFPRQEDLPAGSRRLLVWVLLIFISD